MEENGVYVAWDVGEVEDTHLEIRVLLDSWDHVVADIKEAAVSSKIVEGV